MGIYYENKIYGIRCKDQNSNILFEIYFRTFSIVEKRQVATFYNNFIQNNDNDNSLDKIVFQVYKSYSTSFEFCANRDDMPSYMWVDTPTKNIQDLINE
jgi:hypothetical protein